MSAVQSDHNGAEVVVPVALISRFSEDESQHLLPTVSAVPIPRYSSCDNDDARIVTPDTTSASKRLGDDRERLSRMDVYRIPKGATVQDAIAGSNGATKETYIPGGNDVVMTVTAQDLGIPVGQPAPPNFTISAQVIFNSLS